jgi:U3 small nucleolar RNA-associated protein 13
VTFAVHPKGHEVATASRNLMIRYWDWQAGEAPRCTRAFKAHETPVLSMAYDATGTLLATGGSDRTVKVWDVPGGFCTHNFRGHEGIVTLVQFHPDPRRELLFSCADDTTVRMWTLATAAGAAAAAEQECGGDGDGDGGGGGARKKRPAQQRSKGRAKQQKQKDPCLEVLTNHMSAVTGLGVSRDGRTLATAGRDQVVSLWALDGQGAAATVALLESLPVYEVVEGLLLLDPAEARTLGYGRWDGSEFGGRVPDAEQEALHRDRHKRPRPGSAPGAGNAGREGAFVLAGAKGRVRAFYFKPKPDAFAKGLAVRCVAEQGGVEAYPRGYSGLLRGHGAQLLAVTVDHNLHWLHGGSLRRERVLVGYNDQIIDLKYLGRDGRRVAVASNSPQVRIFSLADLGCEGVLEGQHTETVLSLDASPDGRWLLTGAKDRTACLWRVEPCGGADATAGSTTMLATTCVARYEGHTDAVSAVALTRRKAGYERGGVALAFSAGTDRTLKRWALQPQLHPPQQRRKQGGGEEEGEAGPVRVTEATASVLAHDKDINALAVAPNDALVASASQDKTVKLWDTRRLALVGTLRGHKRGVWSVEFSPIDRCVVTGSGDRTVRLWSLADFSCLKSLEGHGASVLRATFLRSGLQVLSTGADGLLKLWTVRTQECEATLDGHEERVWALALAPSGTQAVTGGGDSLLNVWEDVTAQEEAAALHEAEALVEKEQALANSVHRKDYRQVRGDGRNGVGGWDLRRVGYSHTLHARTALSPRHTLYCEDSWV